MKLQTIGFFAVQLLFLEAGCSIDTKGGELFEMVNLGKPFFADNVARPWQDAKMACEDAGLKLAKITSDKQVEFLRSSYNETTFKGWYWIGARDSQMKRAMSWDDTKTEPENLTSMSWISDTTLQLLPLGFIWSVTDRQLQQCIKCPL